MPNEKYTCRCLRKTNNLASYFKDGIRVTVCDECAEEFGLTGSKDIIKVDYKKIKESSIEENFYHMIDTREKQ